MKTSIEIIISPSGDIKIDAIGFKGADCEKATRYLEEALGLPVQRTRKPEFHQVRKVQSQQKVGP